MDSCSHPSVARQRNADHMLQCALCGAVLEDQQFEMDPVFEGNLSGGGGRSGRGGPGASRGTAAGSLRSLGGSLRPTRHTDTGLHPSSIHNSRATIEQARLQMMNIARTSEIDPNTVEIALGIYASALRAHVVSGTRSVVLRACLYAACRRQKTTHIIYDFVEPDGDSAHAILTHMKLICEGTNTEVPVIDPSALMQRLAEQMELGEHTADVVVCALKVLRAMRDDWIACGRRPMGVCAAALLVGCYVFNIPRSPEEVCGMARLTSHTITKRLNEFSSTPAAELESIDDYQPSGATLPPAFNDSSRKSTEEDMGAEMRELSSLYYELVAEAKVSTPATPERCEKWRRFLEKHCELEQQEPNEANLDLRQLTPIDQLRILGLPHTKPIPYEVVEESVKREETKMTLKVERGASTGYAGDGGFPLSSLATQNDFFSQTASAEGSGAGYDRLVTDSLRTQPRLDLDDPTQLQRATEHYKALMQHNDDVRDLHNEFDFDDEKDPLTGTGGGGPSPSPTPVHPSMGASNAYGQPLTGVVPLSSNELEERDAQDATRLILEEILRDKERRHALPWEFLVLQDAAEEDATDLLPYLVLDNEERVRREKIGLAMYKSEWDRGRPRTREEIAQLEENRLTKRRRRQVTGQQSLEASLQQAFTGRGAATVDTSHLSDIIPELADVEDAAQDDDWGTAV